MRVVFLSLILFITTTVVVSNKLYTPEEERALEKFHPMVKSELPHAYMNEDSYLINWIRAAGGLHVERFQNLTSSYYLISSGMDLNKAKKNLEATLKWRKEQNVDNVMNEDFSDFLGKYPFEVQIGQKDGIVLLIDYANWNLKEATATKDPTRLLRYFYYILETLSTKARETSKTPNVSFLVDARPFDPATHDCETCKGLYPFFLNTLNTHYPQILNRFVVINAPETFVPVDGLIDQHIGKDGKEGKKTYGDNAEEYLQDLDTFIPVKKLPQHFVQTPTPKLTETPKPIVHHVNPDWLSMWKACGGCNLG